MGNGHPRSLPNLRIQSTPDEDASSGSIPTSEPDSEIESTTGTDDSFDGCILEEGSHLSLAPREDGSKDVLVQISFSSRFTVSDYHRPIVSVHHRQKRPLKNHWMMLIQFCSVSAVAGATFRSTRLTMNYKQQCSLNALRLVERKSTRWLVSTSLTEACAWSPSSRSRMSERSMQTTISGESLASPLSKVLYHVVRPDTPLD